MKELKLPYEIKPYTVSQQWGIYRPEVYGQFGFTNHNGEDVLPGLRKEVRAPFDYEVVAIKWQPNGGGLVCTIVSQSEYEGPGGKPANVFIDFLHLQSIEVVVGQRGELGDLLCYADNTGFSTGPHTHIAHTWVKRMGAKWVNVEKNDANGTFNPTPFRDGTFALDLKISKLQAILASVEKILRSLLR